MDENKGEEFKPPPAKKARLDLDSVAQVPSPAEPGGNMEDRCDFPSQEPRTLENPLPTVEAANNTECLGSANSKKPQFSLPGLASSPDQLEGHISRETALELKKSLISECAPAKSLDGAQVLHAEEASIVMPEDSEGGTSFSHLEHEISQTSSKEAGLASSVPLNQKSKLHGPAAAPTLENACQGAQSDRPPVGDDVHNSVDATETHPLLPDTSSDTTTRVKEVPNKLPSAIEINPRDEDIKTLLDRIPGEATQIRSPSVTAETPTTTFEEGTLPGTAGFTATTTKISPRDSTLNAMQFQYNKATNHDGAEFEMDSSPLHSSSSDLSSSSSSSDDSDDDYEMLDPEEQARRLMQEDAGSDDEKGKKGANGSSVAPLRTLNEKPDETVEKPNVTVTPDMKVGELGSVEAIVENLVLIKAKITGEYQVLETGSVLCLEDRTVIGVVAEILGRVQQPLYSVRFTNAAAIAEAGITKGVRIFYVEAHSIYVFTQPLKALRGSDASNIYDEEVGDDELEFSDDEAEAEYKRTKKIQRQSRRGGRGSLSNGSSRGPRPPEFEIRHKGDEVEIDYGEAASMKYDKNAQDDEPYTPLVRPTNLHEMMNLQNPPLETRQTQVSRLGGGTSSRGRWDGHRRHTDYSRGGRGRLKGRGDHQGGQEGRAERGGFQNCGGSSIQSPSLPPKPTSSLPLAVPMSSYGSMGPPQLPMAPRAHYPQASLDWPQQYQNLQTHGYEPYQQTQYPSNYNQAAHSYSYPPSTPQNHTGHHPINQFQQYAQQQQPPQAFQPPPQSSDIPPGAFINPAFFGNQFSQSPQQQHFSHRQPSQSPAPPPNCSFGQRLRQTRMSPESDVAFKAAQDRLEVLRQLS